MHQVKELQMLLDNSLFSNHAWDVSSIKFRESIREQLSKAIKSFNLDCDNRIVCDNYIVMF